MASMKAKYALASATDVVLSGGLVGGSPRTCTLMLHVCSPYTRIEDLNLRPAVKKAIILLLFRDDIKVLKDALAH